MTGFDCCQDLYAVPHTYIIIHYAIFLCITTAYMRLSYYVYVYTYANDPQDFGNVF